MGAGATVLMGGILNEPVEGSAMPVDVTRELKDLGVFPCQDVPDMVGLLKEMRTGAKP